MMHETLGIKAKGNFNHLKTLQGKQMIMIFLALLFMKTPYKIFLLTFTMFKHVEVGKHVPDIK